MYHIDTKGNAQRCTASVRACPFGEHGETAETARALYEKSMNGNTAVTLTKQRTVAPLRVEEFSLKSHYGDLAPRPVQLEALNSVANELEGEAATQLVAACGTGKTYMHRQLLAHFLGKEGSSGVGVVLTSSIRLAHDTAADLRPTGGYDKSMGEFGVDYEVIEVHSDARPAEGRQSVRDQGVISVERIHSQLSRALAQGKKVVIVSTYDSVGKVQEAQAKFSDPTKVEADILIHDEAHNILGQQKPTTVASDENELTAYTGFHNSVPGAVQARRRLYSTATPVVRETESDKEPTGGLPEAIAVAELMKEGHQKERVTVYSDDPLVGRVSGFISQEEAIAHECLARPSYQVREATLRGALRGMRKPVVTPAGELVEAEESTSRYPLTPKTYGALKATLSALVADPEDEETNTSHNALAYVGSIHQAEAFKEAFREAALAESQRMSLSEASEKVDSPDPAVKRQARMRLLAEHAVVKAAHSRTDSDAVRERKEAFAMFHGHAATSSQWTPDKRVLANVDIFSEGVSIPEIDTVVISDDDKFSEKAMTQAIGRAIRVVPNNSYKKKGHVIIPSVKDSEGVDLTASSVNLAAYTSTRVERGSTASKLRGERVAPDDHTTFKLYKEDGSSTSTKARAIAQASVTDLKDLAVAAEMSTNHTYLLANDPVYRTMSPSERFQARKTRIDEKLERLKKAPEQKAYLLEVREHLRGKSLRDVQTMMKNSRVVGAALSTGDVSSLAPEVSSLFLQRGVLSTGEAVAEITKEEKVEYLQKHEQEFAYAILTTPPKMSEEHREARALLPEDVMKDKKMLADNMKLLRGVGGATPSTERLGEAFREMLSNDEFVSKAFAAVTRSDEQAPPILNAVSTKDVLRADKEALEATRLSRQREAAEQGEQTYVVNPSSVKKTGELTSLALRRLLGSDESF